MRDRSACLQSKTNPDRFFQSDRLKMLQVIRSATAALPLLEVQNLNGVISDSNSSLQLHCCCLRQVVVCEQIPQRENSLVAFMHTKSSLVI